MQIDYPANNESKTLGTETSKTVMAYDKVISFGVSCQPVKQIRNQLNQQEAYFFDWMISPLPAVMKVLENDFDNLLLPQNLNYSDHRKIRIVDSANGLEYQHDFPVDKENPEPAQRHIILNGFADHADSVREKYHRRIERTQGVLNSGQRILIVRYVQIASELTVQMREEFMNLLRSKHPSGDLNFLWASPLISGFTIIEDGYLCNLPHSPNWDGDANGWTKVFLPG